uniref:Golgin B1 n=1 Tax=Petromyzon marinus TaxID=7757 RepID=S4RLD2_PETMA
VNESLARLAAFTRSMMSLQDDRDRVLEETKKWESRFQESIEQKEKEVLLKEDLCQKLQDEAKNLRIQVEELGIRSSRLEQMNSEVESSYQKVMVEHEQEKDDWTSANNALTERLNEVTRLFAQAEDELKQLKDRSDNLAEISENAKKTMDELRASQELLQEDVHQKEKELQRLMLACDELQTDVQNQRQLTEQLEGVIASKEEAISRLLVTKESEVSEILSDARQGHEQELRHQADKLEAANEEKLKAERELQKMADRLTSMEAKVKKAYEDKKKLEAFTKSMASLQADRDNVVSEYKSLEVLHLTKMSEKDQLIQEAASEANGLQQEIRDLLAQADDLNAENARLSAQLARYREDLDQVLTLKDSQRKQLLKKQLDKIRALENEKADVEREVSRLHKVMGEREETIASLRGDGEQLSAKVEDLETEVAGLIGEKEQLLRDDRLGELQQKLDSVTAECRRLGEQLAASEGKVQRAEGKLVEAQQEADRKLKEAEASYNKDLASLRHESGVLRVQSETSDERVAELVHELQAAELAAAQATHEARQRGEQCRALRGALASLQAERDQLETGAGSGSRGTPGGDEELPSLRAELARMREDLAKLAALRSDESVLHLESRVDELTEQLARRDAELARLPAASSSRAGAPGGTAREEEAEAVRAVALRTEAHAPPREPRRMEERRLGGAAAETAVPATEQSQDEVQSLRNSLAALQDDRDRLLWELRGLREQYVRIGEESGDIPHLRAEMHDLKQQAMAQQALQGAHREEMSILQVQVSHMRSDNEALLAENQAMKEQFLATLADRDSRIAELQRFCQELRSQSEHSKITSMTCKSWGSPHQTAADGGDGSTPEEVLRLQSELQRCLQELHQKELRLQQLNNKLLVAVEERNVLTGQLKSRSLSLRDAQQRLSDVQGRYRGLESECQALRHSLHHGDNVPPGAPQERASARLEVDPAEVAELQRRLTETEQLHDTSHQERSRLEETLNEERERRVAAEEALLELEEKMNRYGWRSVNTPLQFPCNIRPRVSSPQMRGGGWWCRRWLGGRAAYCSRLLRSRPLARVALLCYLLVLHAAVLMCYLGLL